MTKKEEKFPHVRKNGIRTVLNYLHKIQTNYNIVMSLSTGRGANENSEKFVVVFIHLENEVIMHHFREVTAHEDLKAFKRLIKGKL